MEQTNSQIKNGMSVSVRMGVSRALDQNFQEPRKKKAKEQNILVYKK